MTAPLLDVQGARIAYGDLTAVWDVSLTLRAGTTCALVGRNGAGKSTLLLGIVGLLPLKAGTLELDGEDLTHVPSHRRTSRGIALVPEGKRVFRDMTVRENLLLGGFSRRGRSGETQILEGAFARFPALAPRQDERAGALSGGQQQMLALAQALVSEPRVLLLDEPASGLAPAIVEEVYAAIEDLKAEGISIVLVEQELDKVLGGIADDVVLVDSGRVVLAGAAADLSLEQLTAGASLG
jgi:branched-chain amino acid transport system ATP-binding protein